MIALMIGHILCCGDERRGHNVIYRERLNRGFACDTENVPFSDKPLGFA
jgi:hypothetical protein